MNSNSFNQEYNQNSILKDKKKGRNKDFLVSEMDNYQEMVEELDKHQDNLNKANEKSIKLDTNSNEVKDIVDNLKNSFGSKDKYVLTENINVYSYKSFLPFYKYHYLNTNLYYTYINNENDLNIITNDNKFYFLIDDKAKYIPKQL